MLGSVLFAKSCRVHGGVVCCLLVLCRDVIVFSCYLCF